MISNRPGGAGKRVRSSLGFSLVELLTILVLIGITTSIAVPRLDFQSYAVVSTSQRVSSLLLRAQRQAVQEQHPVVVAFDVAGNRLRVHDDENGNLLIDGGEDVRYEELDAGVRLRRGIAPPLFGSEDDVTFSTMQAGLPAVVFHRNGSASEEGGFYLVPARSLEPEGRLAGAYAAEIQRSTGRATWFRYVGTAWKNVE